MHSRHKKAISFSLDTIKYALDNMLITYQKGTYIENNTMEIKTYDY